MPKGIVKWFNNAKGFGFILADNTSEDIFAHYSAIDMDGFRTLKAGQTVDFEIVQAEKGLHAANIRVTETVATSSAKPEPQQQKARDLAAEHA